MGKLLEATLERLDNQDIDESAFAAILSDSPAGEAGAFPVVVKIPTHRPEPGEDWVSFEERMLNELGPYQEMMSEVMGLQSDALLLANSVATHATREQIRHLQMDRNLEFMDLDPVVLLTQMDDAPDDIGLTETLRVDSELDGSGVSLAILDSGVDTFHSALRVHESFTTCGEDIAIPGVHGTHCAGIAASRDTIYRGVAPGVRLINGKVLSAAGRGKQAYVVRGLDTAMALGVDICSMSLGWNHLPVWSQGGHGWTCDDGNCLLCTAVDNASDLGMLVVAAAGNEHMRAEDLRKHDYGKTFDTELVCPGQARSALSVGAVTKRTMLPASFSSHGPTSYGTVKPDISAPGVNIMSTIPVPRDAMGQPLSLDSLTRGSLFGRDSGTSMATPIVAGICALLIQRLMKEGSDWTPEIIRNLVMNEMVNELAFSPEEVGVGSVFIQ